MFVCVPNAQAWPWDDINWDDIKSAAKTASCAISPWSIECRLLTKEIEKDENKQVVDSSGSTSSKSSYYTTDSSSGSVGNSEPVFTTVVSKGVELFGHIRTIVFILGAFGLVGLSVASIFGRPLWKWYGFLVTGLMMVGVAGSIVNYFVGGDLKTGAYSSAFSSASWEDTLRHSASGAGVSSDV